MSKLQTEEEFLETLDKAISEGLEHEKQRGVVPIDAVHQKFVEDTFLWLSHEVRGRLLDLEEQGIRSRPDKIDRLVEAYIKMAKANHYLVRVVLSDYTSDDLDEAEQLLIIMDNEADNKDPDLNLALDILEQDRRAMR